MRVRISTASSTLAACTTYQISFHRVTCNRSQNISVFCNLIGIVNCSTDAHAILSVWFLESQLGRTKCLVESTWRWAAVEFSEIRVVDFDVWTGDRSKFNVYIVTVDITHIVKIRSAWTWQSKLYQSSRWLSCDTPTLYSKVIKRSPTITSRTSKFCQFILASSPSPVPDGYCICRDVSIDLLARLHLPSCLRHERDTESTHPDCLFAVVFEVKSACWFEGKNRETEK